MLVAGAVKLTVGDLYSIIHPNEVKQLGPNERPKHFVPGWLTDTVCPRNINTHDKVGIGR